jgi:hypothetical protein
MNEALSRAIASRVKAVNLAMDGRTPWDLERRADQILGLHPRIIVIQSDMIVKRRIKREIRPGYFEVKQERLKNWISYVKSPLMSPIYGAPTKKTKELLDALSSPAQIDIKILREKNQQDEIKLEQLHQQRAREHWSGQIISVKSLEFKSSNRFIQKAYANGTHVLIVETPISETASRYASEEYLKQRKEIVLSLLNEPDSYLQYPRVLPDRFFDDYSHANSRGQKVYFKWLAAELAKKLPEQK